MMARRANALVLVVLLLTSVAYAAPRKVLVLPVEGNAPAALRTKLSGSIQRLARLVDGEVTAGTTTITDTAAAVGCEPTAPACVETVRKTLGVDELIYGSANEDKGQITIVVHRMGHKVTAKQIRAQILATDPPEQADPAILPLFTGGGFPEGTEPPPDPPTGTGTQTGSTGSTGSTGVVDSSLTQGTTDPTQPEPEPLPPQRESSRDRNIGIAMAIGGGAMLLIGVALWSSKASVQDEIDDHPRETLSDFRELEELESKASTRGWAGNLMVLGGLAVGGYGGYLLWRDRKARQSTTITPAPTETGTGAMLIIRGRL